MSPRLRGQQGHVSHLLSPVGLSQGTEEGAPKQTVKEQLGTGRRRGRQGHRGQKVLVGAALQGVLVAPRHHGRDRDPVAPLLLPPSPGDGSALPAGPCSWLLYGGSAPSWSPGLTEPRFFPLIRSQAFNKLIRTAEKHIFKAN